MRTHYPPSSPAPARLVPVGYIPKAHGIRGEVALILDAESDEILREELFALPRGCPVTTPEKCRKLAVRQFRRHHGSLLASFAGITTRTEAEALRQHTIFILRDEAGAEDGEVYLRDLPGLRVFIQENGARREIGVIVSADVPAGQELWTIATPDGKEILFPAVPEFVAEIRPDTGTVCIAPPPGLLELYLSEN